MELARRRLRPPSSALRALRVACLAALWAGVASAEPTEPGPIGGGSEPESPAAAEAETAGSLAMSADEPAADDDWDDWDDWDEELDTVPEGYPDPFEPVNRAFLSFNNGLDRLALDPVTRLYRFVLPDFAREALVRVLSNVNSPQVLVNDGLQLEWRDAGVITARLVINSTAGLAGIFDAAEGIGLEHHESDFGQTLAIAGVPSGTYFVLPILGPANIRDGIGIGVDALLHPTFYLLPGTDLLLFGGSASVVTRARHFEELQALKEGSVDFYSAMRSAYYQDRQARIWSRRAARRPLDAETAPGIGGYEDEIWQDDGL